MSTRRDLAVLAVAVLAATAGCGAIGADDADPDREPYGVDEAVEPELAPGLTAEGITDGEALRDAHLDGLENESYVLVARSTVPGESRVRSDQTLTQAVAGDAAELIVEVDVDRADFEEDRVVATHVWRDDGGTYTRHLAGPDDVVYGSGSAIEIDPAPPFSLREVYEVVDTVERDGDGYRLRGSGETDGYGAVSADLRLASDGVLEAFRVEVTRSGDERPPIEYDGSVDRDADPELAAPDWLEEARAELESDRNESASG